VGKTAKEKERVRYCTKAGKESRKKGESEETEKEEGTRFVL